MSFIVTKKALIEHLRVTLHHDAEQKERQTADRLETNSEVHL